MTPAQIADSLEVATTTVQLAVSAAVEELLSMPAGDPNAAALKLALSSSYGRMRGTYGKFNTEPTAYSEAAFPHWFEEAAPVTPEAWASAMVRADRIAELDLCEDEGCPQAGTPHVCVVTPLPVTPRTSWTVLKNLDGARVHTSSGFSAGGAWSWIVDTVADEYGMSETEADERIGSREGVEDQYDGDDLVTVDGEPVYRIEHTATPFSK